MRQVRSGCAASETGFLGFKIERLVQATDVLEESSSLLSLNLVQI